MTRRRVMLLRISSPWRIAWIVAIGAVGAIAATTAPNWPLTYIDDADAWSAEIYCGNPSGGAFVQGPKRQSALTGVISFDSRGNGYVGNGTFIVVVSPDGQARILTGQPDISGNTDGPPGRATFGEVIDLAVVNDDLIYVADAANFTLRRLTRKDGVWQTETVAGTPGKSGHRDGPGKEALFCSVFDSVVADAKGVVYVFNGDWLAKFENGAVTTLNPQGGTGYVNGPLVKARFAHSQGARRGLALDGKGNLFVADKVNACIRKVDLARGEVTTIAGRLPEDTHSLPRDGRGTASRFHPGGGPNMMVYNSKFGALLIHSDDEGLIRIVKRDGEGWVTQTFGPLPNGKDELVGPWKLCAVASPLGVDAGGNFYVTGPRCIRVLKKGAGK